jgi:pyruvate kinase
MRLRRAKIVCTIGPASDGAADIGALIDAGMDVARLNFSHGTRDEHARRIETIRACSRAAGKPIAVLQDLAGPKIRTGHGGPASVATGASVDLVAGAAGAPDAIAVEYEGLAEDLRPGDVVRLDDGRIVLRVVRVGGGRVACAVEQGGPVRDRIGANLPSRRVRLSAPTPADRQDLAFGLAAGVDYVALSFVKRPEDLADLRAACRAVGREVPLVAKIETPEAAENLWDVVGAADAVMVARGDLGVEMGPEVVPVVQREIIGACRLQQKPVIVATEMLQSMVESTRPTRAEASDVAAAVFEGADALMLSAETAAGKHPREACAMMARIIDQAEGSRFYAPPPSDRGRNTAEAIAHAAADIAAEVGARGAGGLHRERRHPPPHLQGPPGRPHRRLRRRRGRAAPAGPVLGRDPAGARARPRRGDAGDPGDRGPAGRPPGQRRRAVRDGLRRPRRPAPPHQRPPRRRGLTLIASSAGRLRRPELIAGGSEPS